MRLTIKSLWVILVAYSLLHLVFFNQGIDGALLLGLLRLEGEPLVLMVFNLMGLMPLAFLLYALSLKNLEKKDYGFIGLGFLTGAFSLAPFLWLTLDKPLKGLKRSFSLLVWAGLILSIITILYGVIYGDISSYYQLFLEDSFIHVMTIDFIVLNILMMLVMVKHAVNPFVEWVPVVGFYQWLLKIKKRSLQK